MKLIRLRKIAQELNEKKEILNNIWKNMQSFAQGLRNELDDMYWSENKIAFTDLESTPHFNEFRFSYEDLKKLFDIEYAKQNLDDFRRLNEEKVKLEGELGISVGSLVPRQSRA
jgi:hypothetical protein